MTGATGHISPLEDAMDNKQEHLMHEHELSGERVDVYWSSSIDHLHEQIEGLENKLSYLSSLGM